MTFFITSVYIQKKRLYFVIEKEEKIKMRYIPIEKIKEGMVVGKEVHGKNGQVLIKEGTPLRNVYVQKLKQLGYAGIYIEDKLSKGIEIKEMVESSIKKEALETVKKVCQSSATGKEFSPKHYEEIASAVSDVLEQIVSKPKLLINMIDLKTFDDYTYSHSVNVGVLAMAIGAHMGMHTYTLRKLGISSFMHDLGKLYIPLQILNKPGKLTPQEMERVRTHPREGISHINEKIKMPEDILVGILDHHERPDGTGYPNRKRGPLISRIGSIIAVADVYDALTSNRPYRKALTSSEAIEYIMGNVNTQFSERVVNSFLKKVSPFPVGTQVKLSNGHIGIVVKNYTDIILRPKVRIIKENDKEIEPYDIDLKNDTSFLNITVLCTHY